MNIKTIVPGEVAAPAGTDPLGPLVGGFERAVSRVVELLEDHGVLPGPGSAALDELAATFRAAGLDAQRERRLVGGGTVDLLINADPRDDAQNGGVAVVVADHGATDALRGRLRRLGMHREVVAVVVATTRPRHRALTGEVRQVPVHVVVLGGGHRRQARRATPSDGVGVPAGGGSG